MPVNPSFAGDDQIGIAQGLCQSRCLHHQTDAGGKFGTEQCQRVAQAAGGTCAGRFPFVGQTGGGEHGGIVSQGGV